MTLEALAKPPRFTRPIVALDQENPRHKQFIAENSDNWKKVRVFDSYVESAPR